MLEPTYRSQITSSQHRRDRKSTRLNSSHGYISYAVFCLKKKKKQKTHTINTWIKQSTWICAKLFIINRTDPKTKQHNSKHSTRLFHEQTQIRLITSLLTQ